MAETVATFEDCVSVLDTLGCGSISHSRRTLLDHLIGTYRLLSGWGAPQPLCLAGLFHSVYGTESFHPSAPVRTSRDRIRDTVGEEAEAIVWLFGMKESGSFRRCLSSFLSSSDNRNDLTLLNRIDLQKMPCLRQQFEYLINLSFANSVEQAQLRPDLITLSKAKSFLRFSPHLLPDAAECFHQIYGSLLQTQIQETDSLSSSGLRA